MSPYTLLVLSPILGTFAAITANIGIRRIVESTGPLAAVFLGVAIGWIVNSAVALWTLGSISAAIATVGMHLLLNQLTYLAIAYGYFNFVNYFISSLRIRVLLEVLGAPEGIEQSELLARYGGSDLVDNRLERLLQRGHMVVRDNRYRPTTSPMLLLAILLDVMKRLVVGRPHAVRLPSRNAANAQEP